VLGADVVDEFRRDDARPSPLRPLSRRLSRPSLLGDQSLELVDGDESRSPRHLDRLDQRQDASVERRAADSDGRGRLRARVGESLDMRLLANDLDWCRGWLGRFVPASLVTSASQAAARHAYNVHKC
jgi:hypothetical protein